MTDIAAGGRQILSLRDRARWVARAGVLIPAADVLFLSVLWTVATVFFGYVLHGKEVYAVVPWWWMVVVAIEVAALWESFGVSLGMRLMGVKLPVGRRRSKLVYWMAWHLLPVAVVIALVDRSGILLQERLSGTLLEEGRPLPRSWYRTSLGWSVLLICVFVLGAAVAILEINLEALFTRFHRTVKFWQAIARPDTSLLGRGIQLLIETFFMALMATLLAVPVAVVLSFIAARNLMRGPLGRPIYVLVRLVGSFTRSVDAVIWAIIFAVWVGMGAFAGALALWLHSIVDLMKLFGEQLESIDRGPVEAITATGASQLEVIRYAIIPQIINPYLSFALYRWDINVRMATVVGLVGGGGIGFRLAQYLKAWAFAEATMLTILIVILVWAIDYLSARLRAKLA